MPRHRRNNPYAAGAGVRPPELAGRAAEFQAIGDFLARRSQGLPEKSMVVTGPRGVGKTVLLNEFEEVATGEGWSARFYELPDDVSFPDVLARIARQTILELSARERWRQRMRRPLEVLKSFSLSLDLDGLRLDVDPFVGLADSGDVSDDLRDLFVEMGAAAADCGTGILLLLDELQNVDTKHYEAMILALHRVDQKSLPLGIVGAGLPLLPELTGQAKSYAERMFHFRSIGQLSPDAAREALEVPAERHGVDFERDALDAILQLSDRYPYFLQEYGRFAWNASPSPTISAEDVRQTAPLALEYLDDGFFRVRMARVTKGLRRYLVAMSELGDGPYPVSEVRKAGGYKSLQATSPARNDLIRQGLVYAPERGFVDFTVPHFADFIRRRGGG